MISDAYALSSGPLAKAGAAYMKIINHSEGSDRLIGVQSDIAKKMIDNLNVSSNLIQYPDSLGVGKLASCMIFNEISTKETTFAFDKFKPIYVRSAQIN